MSSIFLRIYGGLLFTLVLVAVLSGISVTLINGLRQADYREDMVRGTFRLAAEDVAELPEEQRQPWLKQQGISLGILDFKQVGISDVSLTEDQAEELQDSGILIQTHDAFRFTVLSPIDESSLLSGTLAGISEQTASSALTLLNHRLAEIPESLREAELAKIVARSFSYPVELVQPASTQLQPFQLSQLESGGSIQLLDNEAQRLMMFSQVPGDSRLIQMGPLDLLNPYPFKLMLTLGLFVLTSLSLAIYLLVRGMEKRLRKLERAATRFSRGDFDVRVTLDGADSIGRLAQAFNAMAGHIQRLLSLQKEMIRGVSHELRTPVARLRFGLDLIADAETREERDYQLEGMDKDIEELDKLVDEFLTYANLEQGAPEIRFKRYDVDKVLAQVVEEHKRLQDRVQIEHTPCNMLDPRRFADIDFRYIHRAVQNLVGNACRYADGKITVKFSATQDTCRVDVDDDGPGIPEDQWDRVFSAFSRLDDSRTRKSGGYGLGLSIVRRIMYWHNGRAMVSHSPMGGARFSLVWPRKQKR
ncbi:two-component sensor histidine kinase [Endozoicomonas sp. OPT23]|uniref:ATP-binding protein n=1 Tax=Endozoicomonas sp. OPT23 TaxID=2072845 RepID=UPI00129BAD40|nr:two-component sensor histidine kinase [Endozoicomonas sp. OPT23]